MTHVREDRDPERDVVQAVRVVEEVADPAGRVVVDAADPGEAGDVRHLAERVGGDHRVGEGDHQEVDAGAPGRDRAADQPDHGGEDEREDQGDGRVPAEMEPFRRPARAALGRHVPVDDPRDPEERGLRERDHAAVGREEDEARRGDPEDEGLEQDRVAPVRAEAGGRPDEHEQERRSGDPPLDLLAPVSIFKSMRRRCAWWRLVRHLFGFGQLLDAFFASSWLAVCHVL